MCTQLSPPSRSSRVPRFVSDIVFQWSSLHCFHSESDMFRASFGSSDKTLLQLHRTAKDDEKIEKEKRRKLRNASSILSVYRVAALRLSCMFEVHILLTHDSGRCKNKNSVGYFYNFFYFFSFDNASHKIRPAVTMTTFECPIDLRN